MPLLQSPRTMKAPTDHTPARQTTPHQTSFVPAQPNLQTLSISTTTQCRPNGQPPGDRATAPPPPGATSTAHTNTMTSARPPGPAAPPTATITTPPTIPILTTPRCQIRPFHPTDAASLVHHGNHRSVWLNLRNTFPHPYTSADASAWISRCSDPATGHRPTHPGGSTVATDYAIAIDGALVGAIGLIPGGDIEERCGKIGYWLGPEVWGRGFMSEVLPVFVEWVWATFGEIIRLEAVVYEGNVASGAVLGRAGFRLEGRKECAVFKDGRVGDKLIYCKIRGRG